MLKIAISGNIASGKSQVEKILLSEGFKVIDSDEINHYLITSDCDVISEIKSVFGLDVFLNNAKIDKNKLGEIIFSNPKKKQQLEKILHKRIFEKINLFFEQNKNEKLVFVSVPLLFEVHWEKQFDKIIFISTKEELRLKRLIKRNNYTLEYAKQRLSSQENEKEKIQKSDFVIYNNSDLNDLKKSVLNIVKSLQEE